MPTAVFRRRRRRKETNDRQLKASAIDRVSLTLSLANYLIYEARLACLGVLALSFSATIQAAGVQVDLLADICPGSCSSVYPRNFLPEPLAVGGKLFFQGNDGVRGVELWATDATPAGTLLLADINPGPSGSYPGPLTAVGNAVYFTASTPRPYPAATTLWRSDGTPQGTYELRSPAGAPFSWTKNLTDVGGELWFWNFDDQSIWRSDGTPAGTQRVASFAGPSSSAYPVTGFTASNGSVYYAAQPCVACVPHHEQIWRTDRSGVTTVLLDVPLTATPNSYHLFAFGASALGVFFSIDDELWIVQGAGAPVPLAQLPPNTFIVNLRAGTDLNGRFYFGISDYFASDPLACNFHLWSSDGTAAGTRAEATFPLGVGCRSPDTSILQPWHGELLFTIVGGDLGGIWVLDPSTQRGARQSTNVVPLNLIAYANRLFFVSELLNHPLWTTDGTPAGTRELVLENVPFLDLIAAAGNSLLLKGYTESTGLELYRLQADESAFPVPPSLTVIEYYDASRDHYFVTGDAHEIAVLDGGVIPGWARTGWGFVALAPGSGVPGVSPVCRFYGRPEAGLNSHFYSASPAECAAVQSTFGAAWILESNDVFETAVPDGNFGTCPGGTSPVYRFYDNRPDVDHRYTTSVAVALSMKQQGWISEGYGPGPYGVAMCVLAPLEP